MQKRCNLQAGMRAGGYILALAMVSLSIGCNRYTGNHTITARDGLYLRVEPNQESEKVTLAPSRSSITILSYDSYFPRRIQGTWGYWASASYAGQTGFAFNGFSTPIEGLSESDAPLLFWFALTMLILGLPISLLVLRYRQQVLQLSERALGRVQDTVKRINEAAEKYRDANRPPQMEPAPPSGIEGDTTPRAAIAEPSKRTDDDLSIIVANRLKSSPHYGPGASTWLMALISCIIGILAAWYVLMMIDLLDRRRLAEEWWLLLPLWIAGALLPLGISVMLFVRGTGFGVVNLVRYYLIYRGLDILLTFYSLKYPAIRKAMGVTREDIVLFGIELVFAVGIFALYARYFAKSPRVKANHGRYLKFGDGSSILGIFPSVHRVTGKEVDQLAGTAKVLTTGGNIDNNPLGKPQDSRLTELKELHDKGLISAEEYSDRRKKLLDEL